MAVVMSMHWPEASLEQYEQTRKDVNWEDDVPAGAQFHVAWMADDGFRVMDVWDSAEDFQRFLETRLVPSIQRVGIQGEPKMMLSPVHRVFAPNVPRPPAAKRPVARRSKAAAKKVAPKNKKKTAKKAKVQPKIKGKKRGKR